MIDSSVIARCRVDIEYFGRVFMPKVMFAATPDFHREIYRELQNKEVKRLGIIAPRGHSKSSVTCVLFITHSILFKNPDDDLFAIIISESQLQSINFLTTIKNNLKTNKRILSVFGDLEGTKWAEDEIVTTNGCRVVAKGTGQKVRGLVFGRESINRPNLIVLDDFESETNSNTPEAIDKNKAWITKAVEPSLSDDGRLIVVGTIISERGYLATIRKDPAFRVLFYQAIMGGKPLWPERFPLKKLMALKASYDARGQSDAFWQEYMNIPNNPGDPVFKESWTKFYDGEYLYHNGGCFISNNGILTPVNITIGTDFAITENLKSDFTVILPLARASGGRRMVLPYKRFRTNDTGRIVKEMVDSCKEYNAIAIGCETNQFQQAVANQFYAEQQRQGVFTGTAEYHQRTSKDVRIRSLQPLMAGGNIRLRRDMVELMGEMKSFPGSAHDDVLDALWMAEDLSVEPEVGDVSVEEYDKERKRMAKIFSARAESEADSWLTS